jgi:hypothetical protein
LGEGQWGQPILRRERVMSEEMLSCPLCQGRAQVSRAELTEMLTERTLLERIERYLAELTPTEDARAGAVSGGRDFQKDVHNWNPQLPIWRRSPKE